MVLVVIFHTNSVGMIAMMCFASSLSTLVPQQQHMDDEIVQQSPGGTKSKMPDMML